MLASRLHTLVLAERVSRISVKMTHSSTKTWDGRSACVAEGDWLHGVLKPTGSAACWNYTPAGVFPCKSVFRRLSGAILQELSGLDPMLLSPHFSRSVHEPFIEGLCRNGSATPGLTPWAFLRRPCGALIHREKSRLEDFSDRFADRNWDRSCFRDIPLRTNGSIAYGIRPLISIMIPIAIPTPNSSCV